jgi:hypothetical protein
MRITPLLAFGDRPDRSTPTAMAIVAAFVSWQATCNVVLSAVTSMRLGVFDCQDDTSDVVIDRPNWAPASVVRPRSV